MTEPIIEFLTSNPWIFWVWFGATVVASALRATWDTTEERPRVVRFIIAVVDILQLNFSGPVKLMSRQIKGKS